MRYRICAVIEHIGTSLGGHYINAKNVKRSDGTAEWILCDDINTRKIPESQVMNSIAYMLFYEKIE